MRLQSKEIISIASGEELQVFNFNGMQLRAKLVQGEPWFIGTDLARLLDYSDTNALTRKLDDDEKISVKLTGISATNPVATIINESGLYSAVLSSRKPEAKAFKKWVTSEVLPAIRKTGSYETPKTLEQRSLELLGELTARVQEQQLELESARPKVELHDQIMTAEGHLSVSDAGKLLAQAGVNTGPRKLFADLDALGWTFVRGGKRQIYENIRRQKLLDYKAQSYFDQNRGERVIAEPQIRVTPKGLEKLRIKLLPPLSEELAA